MRSRDTALMEKIRDYAEEYALQNMGMTPSTREIGAALGLHYSRVWGCIIPGCSGIWKRWTGSG